MLTNGRFDDDLPPNSLEPLQTSPHQPFLVITYHRDLGLILTYGLALHTDFSFLNYFAFFSK